MAEAKTVTPAQAREIVARLAISTELKQRIIRDLPRGGALRASQLGNALAGMIRSSRNPTDARFSLDMTRQMTEAGLNPDDPDTWVDYVLYGLAAGSAAAGVAVATPALAPTATKAASASGLSFLGRWGAATWKQKLALAAGGGAATAYAAGDIAQAEQREAQRSAQSSAQSSTAAPPGAAVDDDSPLPMDQAAQALAQGGEATLSVNGQEVAMPEDWDAASFLQQPDTATTLTAEDIQYVVSMGGNPLDPRTLEAVGTSPDAQRIWYDWTTQSIRPDRRQKLAGQPVRAEDIEREEGRRRWKVKKYLSYREAVNLPLQMEDVEVREMARKLWEAGFLQADVDPTEPFEDQFAADRYSPELRNAWQSLLLTSLSDPSKSATQILEERRRARLPILEKMRTAELERRTKDAIRALNFPDPATLAETAEGKMQEILGRDPTEAERQAMLADIGDAYAAEAQKVIDGEQVTNDIDVAARMEQQIERDNAVEVEANRTADAFSIFRSLLGPGGL